MNKQINTKGKKKAISRWSEDGGKSGPLCPAWIGASAFHVSLAGHRLALPEICTNFRVSSVLLFGKHTLQRLFSVFRPHSSYFFPIWNSSPLRLDTLCLRPSVNLLADRHYLIHQKWSHVNHNHKNNHSSYDLFQPH